MNILFFHRWTGVRGGGTESHIKGLLENFSPKHNLYLLTRNGPKVNELKKLYPRLSVFTVSKNIKENDNSYLGFLLYLHTGIFMIKSFIYLVYLLSLKRQKIDVISTHFPTEFIVAKVIRKIYRIPIVFILEGYTDWEGRVAKEANGCISISKYISQKCKQNYGYYPQVIYIGDNKFPLLKKTDLNKKINNQILTLCRLEPRKNLLVLLKTIKYLVHEKNIHNLVFLLAGTGIDEKMLKEKSKELEIQKYVKFLGYISDENRIKLFQESPIFFLPTKEEGFGIVFLEAMKSGCAIVSTNTSATPEIVGDAGVLVDNPDDYLSYANAIQYLIENTTYRNKLSLNGLSRSPLFSWNILIKEYEQVYEKVMSNSIK